MTSWSAEELVGLWQQERRQGREPSAEELCRERPDLLPEVRCRIAALRSTEQGNGAADIFSAETRSGPVPSQDSTASLNPRPGIDSVALGRVGDFELLGELGRGGMGIVFKARDVRLNRLVALKMIRHDSEAHQRERFRTEAEAVARLAHPHIAQVYSSGEHAGQPYLVMELLEGGSLRKALGGRPQPIEDSVRLVLLLARAVHFAHGRGIVHRDLKPSNVLLAPPADEPALNSAWGCPRVADFGLARVLDDPGGKTLSGSVLGTPGYMAPEQAEGHASEVGPAADVYALGVILYELLTGAVPFQADSVLALLRQVVSAPPPPLRQRRPEVPAQLEAICLKCLAKDPGKRYASASALAEALGQFLAASNEGKGEAARPRRRTTWWLVGAASLLLLTGLGGFLTRWGWPPPAPSRDVPEKVGPESVIVQEAPRPPAEPLDPKLTVRVQARGRPWLALDQEGALPVRPGELVRVEVKLNRPGHVLLVLLTSQGQAVPLYPWNGDRLQVKDLNIDPPDVGPVREATSPLKPTAGWKFDRVPGLETVLLLVRDSPPPPGLKLGALLGPVPRGEQAPLRHPQELALLRQDRGDRQPSALLSLNRGIEDEAREVDDPLLWLMNRLRQHFEVVRAVRFAHVGE